MGISECTFCRIVERTAESLILYEDDRIISFLPLAPAVRGHTLIVPKAHHGDVYSIPDDLLSELIVCCKAHALRWRERAGSTGLNILHASGADAQQTVFHFHLHLLPRFANDGVDAWPTLSGARESREEMHAMFRLEPSPWK